jgi:hypothetical protein
MDIAENWQKLQIRGIRKEWSGIRKEWSDNWQACRFGYSLGREVKSASS